VLGAQLDPVPSSGVVQYGGIGGEVLSGPRPSGSRDPQVDRSVLLQVGDLPAAREEGGLVAVPGAPFPHAPGGEHDIDDRVPEAARVHAHARHDRHPPANSSRDARWRQVQAMNPKTALHRMPKITGAGRPATAPSTAATTPMAEKAATYTEAAALISAASGLRQTGDAGQTRRSAAATPQVYTRPATAR
jgi:hypothetical protein